MLRKAKIRFKNIEWSIIHCDSETTIIDDPFILGIGSFTFRFVSVGRLCGVGISIDIEFNNKVIESIGSNVIIITNGKIEQSAEYNRATGKDKK